MQNWQKDKYGQLYIHSNGMIRLEICPHKADGWEIKINGQTIICYDPIESIVADHTHPAIHLDEDDMKLLNEYRDKWNADRLMMEMSGEMDRIIMNLVELDAQRFMQQHLNNIYKPPTL